MCRLLSIIKTDKGFSLIELIIALSLIVILAGAVLSRFAGVSVKGKATRLMDDMDEIKKAMTMYYQDTGKWPQTNNIACLWSQDDTPAELQTLWRGPYIDPPTDITGNNGPRNIFGGEYNAYFDSDLNGITDYGVKDIAVVATLVDIEATWELNRIVDRQDRNTGTDTGKVIISDNGDSTTTIWYLVGEQD